VDDERKEQAQREKEEDTALKGGKYYTTVFSAGNAYGLWHASGVALTDADGVCNDRPCYLTNDD
jgi:hypothetical protein